MEIKYNIAREDWMTYHLFHASQSPRIRKKRWRSKFILPAIYILLAIGFFISYDYIAAIVFGVVSIIWYFFYPHWEKRHYQRHYRAAIAEAHKDGSQEIVLNIENDLLSMTDKTSAGQISTTEMDRIDEIPTLFIIKLNGSALIIPNKI